MTSQSAPQRIVIGMLADEGTPAEVANQLADELPAALTELVCADVDWCVQARAQALPLDEDGLIPMSRLAETHRQSHCWDVLILLTDLPRRTGTQPIMSDYSTTLRVGLISVPALGAIHLRRRAHDLLVHVVRHLFEDRLRLVPGTRDRFGPLVPAHHIDADEDGIDQHLALAGVRGRLRLLAGMVRDNRPWRLVPHLSSATAAAAATAAYGVVTASFWKMAGALTPWRLGLISLLAIAAMTGWLLYYNNLWDSPTAHDERGKTRLYNLSTLVTLLLGVACMYALLYLLTLLAATVLIDSGYLTTQLGRPANPSEYAAIAWLATSIGIVAGALGSSLENEEAVRRATYSHREQQRQKRNARRETNARRRGTEDSP